ncbi:MAG: hypothetical protein R3F60_32255 [bacterium]
MLDFASLHDAVRRGGRPGSAGYPPALREQLQVAVRALRAAGWSWARTSTRLGISVSLARRLGANVAALPALVPVRVAPPGPPATAPARLVTLYSPTGWRIEGLHPEQLPALLPALS